MRLNPKTKNLKDMTFGSWYVRDFYGYTHGAVWICKCSCGKVKNIRASQLLNGQSKSCGHNGVRNIQAYNNEHSLPEGVAGLNALYSNRKICAKRRKIEFTLSVEEAHILFKGKCHYCGSEPLTIFTHHKGAKPVLFNGIDRLDSSIGYVPNNCVSCCKWCNYSKGVRTVDEFKSWIDILYKHMFKGEL